MSQTIKTYNDLCEERTRIHNLLVVQKQRIREDWQELKQEYIPVKNAMGVFSKMTSPDKSNPLLHSGLKVASDIFLKHFILGKAGWAVKLAVPFVVKNYSSHLMAKRGSTFLGKLGRLFQKKNTTAINRFSEDNFVSNPNPSRITTEGRFGTRSSEIDPVKPIEGTSTSPEIIPLKQNDSPTFNSNNNRHE